MTNRKYDLIALEVNIWFNKYGDHDHNGLMYVLKEHRNLIDYIKDLQNREIKENTPAWQELMNRREALTRIYSDEWLPKEKDKAKVPHPLIVPLVLRASLGDTITISLKNEIRDRQIGIHLVGPGTDKKSDGSHVGINKNRLLAYGQEGTFTWQCDYEGVFVFHDAGDFRGNEQGTNVHGLFGALVVEPAGTRWTDPETGGALSSGLYADVHHRSEAEINQRKLLAPYPDPHNPNSLTTEYPAPKASFREFVIFIHDEPEWVAPHGDLEPNPCDGDISQGELMHAHTTGSLMPISYRAEPMISRERQLWQWMEEEKIDPNNIVVNEEQHHSSWLFGDPSTPILKAYLGDPIRIRLVHAGVKETHVFHLHVYEWNAIPFHRDSNIIDAITISPQTGHTIVPFYGAGNRQMIPGDVIWHCHLYPHFHHGMWGIFRTFDKLQEGIAGQYFHGETGAELTTEEVNAISNPKEKNKILRRLGYYPDLSPIQKLVPLPDREAPPKPTISKPGYPLFIAGEVGQKSFTPPWHRTSVEEVRSEGWAVEEYDYRLPNKLELNAFNTDPRPGELFTVFPYPDRDAAIHKLPGTDRTLAKSITVKHNIDVLMTPIKYNDYGWWDPHGHLYALADKPHGIKTFFEVVNAAVHHSHDQNHQITIEPTEQQPLFLRCRKTEVMELTLHNRLERYISATPFDSAWPKGIDKIVKNKKTKEAENCTAFANYKGECGLHVHIVKFDPICADGASTGWNYMSGPQFGKKMVYRWWADEEFGTIFTHDHLFANYRQKHGLFGALLVEPEGATFHNPDNPSEEILVGQSAVIRYQEEGIAKAYREFCFGNCDWVPLFKLDKSQKDDPHTGMVENPPHNMAAMAHGKALPVVAQVTYEAGGQQQKYPITYKDFKKIPKTTITYGIPIEPPNMQDSHDDNGVFAVNYRCEPLHERSRDQGKNAIAHNLSKPHEVIDKHDQSKHKETMYNHDPSEWFNSKPFLTKLDPHSDSEKKFQHGDPNTPIFHTLPGERVRLRLVQGSHEEQHSFQLHGLRWRRFWHDSNSPICNQQTIGISEAFSFDIEQNYGAGDYLWKYSSAEDLWLGCWGIIRAHDPNLLEETPHNPHEHGEHSHHPPEETPHQPDVMAKKLPPLIENYQPPTALNPSLEKCRRFKVVAKPKTIPYSSILSDPFGLVFNLVAWADPGQSLNYVTTPDDEPLVLRCRQGEWVAIELVNEIPEELEVEPLAPELPHNDGDRTISNKVSLHADLLTYDVREHDGSNVGFNVNSTVENGASHTYYWLADAEVGAVLLQDMADFRNHRHHGLIGALVIEPPNTTPYSVIPNAPTASLITNDVCWYGARATIYDLSTKDKIEEMVLLVQDGLRYYLFGNPTLPIGDIPGDTTEDGPDTEDQGLKGFNLRSAPSSHKKGYDFVPSTPLIKVSPGAKVKLHLVGACDKPRNHSFTLHGHSWQEWQYLAPHSPQVSSTSGITAGSSHTYYFTANNTPGDYMYRSGVLKYAVEQGLWGVMRVYASWYDRLIKDFSWLEYHK